MLICLSYRHLKIIGVRDRVSKSLSQPNPWCPFPLEVLWHWIKISETLIYYVIRTFWHFTSKNLKTTFGFFLQKGSSRLTVLLSSLDLPLDALQISQLLCDKYVVFLLRSVGCWANYLSPALSYLLNVVLCCKIIFLIESVLYYDKRGDIPWNIAWVVVVVTIALETYP